MHPRAKDYEYDYLQIVSFKTDDLYQIYNLLKLPTLLYNRNLWHLFHSWTHLFFFNILLIKLQWVELHRVGHWVPHIHLTLNARREGQDWRERYQVSVKLQLRLTAKAFNTEADVTVSILSDDKWDSLSVMNL